LETFSSPANQIHHQNHTSDMINSPLLNTPGTRLVEKIPVSIILRRYKDELHIDAARFFKTDYVEIHECLATGFRFYYPFDIAGDDKLYKALQKKDETYYRKWNWEHDTAHRVIKKGDKVLEVGCGTGSFLERLAAEGFDVYGLELNNEAVKVCRQKGLTVYNELLNTHLKNNYQAYDMVCSFQVLEHIPHPRVYIQECIDAVKPGGKIIFAVPNSHPYLFKRDKYHTTNLPPHHMGLWSEKAFSNLSGYFNMDVVEIKIEELFAKKQYLNTFFDYSGFPKLKKVTGKLPGFVIDTLARLRKWEGRNIVAIFEKRK
jgi:2-polyprenyl-3-methyl-5-hydroxy-6-metoxy-1,4-benzoquinol methylase